MRKNRRLGLGLIITAPSGAGKSTLIKRLRGEFPEICFSVSCTTRSPRPGELDGRDYHFTDAAAFKDLIDKGHFAEWAEVHGNFYGTPKQEVLDLLANGRDVLFDIDVAGARALTGNLSGMRTVFILPPSRRILEERLRARGSDSPETIAKRLANARGEIAQAGWFEHLVVNAELDRACDELRAVYLACRADPKLHPHFVESLLAEWPD
jgi:guanylate kinase